MSGFHPLQKYCLTCSLLTLLAIGSNWATGQTGNSKKPSDYRLLAHDIFRELIEINTISDSGTVRATEAMAARLKTGGFTDNEIRIDGPDRLHRNLIIRYPGSGKDRPVLFIGHLDVVEAHREDWSFDPFTFFEKGGYFYGRGTTDVKCEVADLVVNLIRLRQEGFKPDRDIIVAFTADEEGGHANGVNWLINNHRNWIDAEYCVNPDGGGGDLKNGKPDALNVQTCEKIYASFMITANNKGGHSSLPVRDNAIYRLSEGLLRIADYDFPVRLNETTKRLLEINAARETGQMKTNLQTLLNDPSDIAAAGRIKDASAYYNAMLRTTCVATLVNAGHAENALPQRASAIINCRMLPEDNPENVLKTLNEIINDTALTVVCTYSSFIAPLSPLKDEVMTPVENIAGDMWPGVNILPVMSTGASDGKYLRKAGIPVYGISGMFGDSNDIRAHGKDERIGTEEFYKGVDFMYRLIKALASGEKL